ERALDHAARGVAVAVHDAVGERTVVGADAQRAAELLAAAHERAEALGNALDLRGPLRVAVLAHGELLLVGEVPGVDPHLLDVLGGEQRRLGREVDVRDERDVEAAPRHLRADRRQVLRLAQRGHGETHDLAARRDEARDLRDAALGIERVGRQHRLHADRPIAADDDVADPHLAGRAPARQPGPGAAPAPPATSAARGRKASSRRAASLPPPCAKPGRPPPLPPSTWLTSRTRSPARSRGVRSAVTPSATATLPASSAASSTTPLPRRFFRSSTISRRLFASTPSTRAARTRTPPPSRADCVRSREAAPRAAARSDSSSRSSPRRSSSRRSRRSGSSALGTRRRPAARSSSASRPRTQPSAPRPVAASMRRTPAAIPDSPRTF